MGVGTRGFAVIAAVSDGSVSSSLLSQRAMELSHDRGVSLAEGAQHLARLAQGRRLPLEGALADLDHGPPNFEIEYARLLLRGAISELAKPPRFGESHLEPAI